MKDRIKNLLNRLLSSDALLVISVPLIAAIFTIAFMNFSDMRTVNQKLEDGTYHVEKYMFKVDKKTHQLSIIKPVSATGYFIEHNKRVFFITNAHVCQGFTILTISKVNEDGLPEAKGAIKVIGASKKYDLCIVELNNKYDKSWKPKALKLALKEPKYMDKAYTYGYPLRFGGVHRSGYFLNIINQASLGKVLGIHVPVVFGQSGSPVVNEKGEVVCTVFAMPRATTTLGYCQQTYKLFELLGKIEGLKL